MLTIWSTCKPFIRENTVNQRNATKSWTYLTDDVILFGKERGLAQIAEWTDCRHISDVDETIYQIPALGGLFIQADKLARHDLLCSVCCDIILMPDILNAAHKVADELDRFLMIGLKWHYGPGEIDFVPGWQNRLRDDAVRWGEQHKKTGGSDYFVYPRGLFEDWKFPRLMRGRYRDDIFLITAALQKGIPVVDATKVVLAIHQPHRKQSRQDEAVRRNVRLTRNLSPKRAVKDATWILDEGGLRHLEIWR